MWEFETRPHDSKKLISVKKIFQKLFGRRSENLTPSSQKESPERLLGKLIVIGHEFMPTKKDASKLLDEIVWEGTIPPRIIKSFSSRTVPYKINSGLFQDLGKALGKTSATIDETIHFLVENEFGQAVDKNSYKVIKKKFKEKSVYLVFVAISGSVMWFSRR